MKNNQIIVRQANMTDKDNISAWLKHYKDEESILSRVVCFLEHNHTVVAYVGKELVGLTQWNMKEDPKGGIAEIEEVAVKEEFKRMGIATQLIETALSSIKDHFRTLGVTARKVYLFVSEGNSKAIRLYEKLGFVYAAKVSNMFSEEEDALIYVKDLRT